MGVANGPIVRAMLAADIVGSTRLRSAGGDARADRMLRVFVDIVSEHTKSHEGEVRRWMGDGVMVSFPSASAAVGAGMAIQRAVTAYGRRSDAAAVFQLRVGIAVGEVVFDPLDGEEHGVAVVEAARLEPLAPPGEVIATELVQLLGARRSHATFEPLGEYDLRGFHEPVRVVRVVDPSANEPLLPVPGEIAVDRRFPLVGRSEAMAEALNAWRRAEAGSAETLLVFGQPGIGKTRLAAQVAEVAHAAQAIVLAGVCDADLAVPYQPIARALADAADLVPELKEAVTSGDGPLGAMFPSRRSRRDDGSAADRLDLFDAVAAVIEELSVQQPVVLVLDDVQWATAPTVQMMRHLMRRLDRARVLIIATSRPEARTLTHPLNAVLVEARSSKRTTTLELSQLGIEDVVELVGARLDEAGESSLREQLVPFATRVMDESAGNPFFVCELVDHLASTGQLSALVGSTGDKLPIPDSVRGIVGQRLSRLDADVSDVLVNAAVVGHSFDIDLVAKLVDKRSDEVLELLEKAAEVALVQELDAESFSFAHAMVRSTVLDQLSASRLARGHRRVAEALRDIRPTSHDQLAFHWQQAGDADEARIHRELAARRDLEAFAFESALERYEQLVAYYGPAETAEAARSLLGLGYARRALGQPEYIHAMLEAGRIGLRIRDADLAADAAVGSIWPGTYLRPGEGFPGFVELAEAALRVIHVDDLRRPRILATVGVHEFDPDRRLAILAEALRAAEATGDPELIGHVLVAEHVADCNPATLDKRLELIKRLMREARACGVPELEYYATLFAVFNAAERGDVELARQRLRELEPSTRAAHGVYLEFMAERISVSLDLFTGLPEPQKRIDALATRFADTHADTTNTWAGQTAILAHYQGRLAPMVPAMRTVLAGTYLRGIFLPTLGMALCAAEEYDEAAEILETAEEPAFDYFWLVFTASLGELAIVLRHVEKARAIYDKLLPYHEQLCIAGPGSLCYGFVAITLARLANVFGDFEASCSWATAGMARADAVGAPYESARGRLALAEALVATGSGGAAAEAIVREALSVADANDFATLSNDLRSLLVALKAS